MVTVAFPNLSVTSVDTEICILLSAAPIKVIYNEAVVQILVQGHLRQLLGSNFYFLFGYMANSPP